MNDLAFELRMHQLQFAVQKFRRITVKTLEAVVPSAARLVIDHIPAFDEVFRSFLAEDGDDELKEFTMIQLAYLALVDGSISDEDRSLLCKVAESLGLDAFNVDSTLQTAAEMSNFPVDFLLEDEVEKVQKMLEEASQIS